MMTYKSASSSTEVRYLKNESSEQSSTSMARITDVPYIKDERFEESFVSVSDGADDLFADDETTVQGSGDVSTSQQYKPLDISKEFLIAAIASKRGKTAKDYSEDLAYDLKVYAIFYQCYLRKKNVREPEPWKESMAMWNAIRPGRHRPITKEHKMGQKHWVLKKAIETRRGKTMIDDVERIVEKFDDESRGVRQPLDAVQPALFPAQPSFDSNQPLLNTSGPSTGSYRTRSSASGIKCEEPNTNDYRLESEVINISDSEDEYTPTGTKRKPVRSHLPTSGNPKRKQVAKPIRASGHFLRKAPPPPPHGADFEMMRQAINIKPPHGLNFKIMRQAINPFSMPNDASMVSGPSGLGDHFQGTSNGSVSGPAPDTTSNASMSEPDIYNRMIETHCREIEGYIIKYHCYFVGLGDVRNRNLSWAESKNDVLQPIRREGRSFLDLMNANILNGERSLQQKGMDYLWATVHGELRDFANRRLRDLGYPVYYA